MRRLPLLTAAIAVVILLFPLTFMIATAHAQRGTLGKNEEHSISVNGTDRFYVLHLPPAYDGKTALPVVIGLHGGGGNPAQYAKDTQFDEKSDKEGFIMVYPHGTGTLETWDAIHCCGQAFDQKVDDVGFISALIDELISKYHADPKQIFVTGHSNGAMLAYRVAAELSNKVAAISVSAGTIGGKAHRRTPLVQIQEPAAPVSVLAFHGKIDQHVLYDGGITEKGLVIGRYDLSVMDSIGFWVKADGCTTTPDAQTIGHISIRDYTDCDQKTEVKLYTIDNQGHAWPGGTNGFIDAPTTDISATDLSWEFFKAHPKQAKS